MKVFVETVGLVGPGLVDWAASRAVLGSTAPYAGGETSLPRLEVLPAAERRRTGMPVKLALAAGLDALVAARRPPASLPTVFTSSGGDGQVLHEICETLASAERQVSPTRFHNSVNNAPAGYWSIAMQSLAPSTSLCAYDWSFAAGLVEASAQVVAGADAALLISFDLPYPEPMHARRPILGTLAVALLLARERSPQAIACLGIEIAEQGLPPTACSDAQLERLRAGNPTGRALPLLAALAAGQDTQVALDYVAGQSLRVRVASPVTGGCDR